MAKVSGPLMSMEAKGSYGGSLVFSKNKGQSVCRQLVKPTNPDTLNQRKSRNRTRVAGKITTWVKRNRWYTPWDLSRDDITDLMLCKERAPSGLVWNAHLTRHVIGDGGLHYDAAQAAFAALTNDQKAAWQDAANAFDDPVPPVPVKDPVDNATSSMSAGEVFFIAAWGLFKLGIATQPGAVPPTYTAP